MQGNKGTHTALFPEAEVLAGDRVSLKPLRHHHVDDLWDVGNDETLWKLNPWPVRSRAEMRAYVEKALGELESQSSFPFVTVENQSGKVIGSTRFMNVNLTHRRVEIGSTWIGRRWQRTGLNRETKYLMLCAAFDDLGYDRVELKTDMLNEQSKVAIRNLGAVEEGVLRHHVVTRSGRIRDTIYFSILRSEWPEIKRALETGIGRSV